MTQGGFGKQGVATVGAMTVGKVSMFALHVLVARRLGAAGYGAFVVAYTIAGLLISAATFGVPKVVMREIARVGAGSAHSTSRRIALSGLKSITATSAILTALVISLSIPLAKLFFSDVGNPFLIVLAGTSLPFFALFGLGQAILHAAQKLITQQALQNIGRPAILLVVTWIALEWVPSPEYALLAYNITGVVILVPLGMAVLPVLRSDNGNSVSTVILDDDPTVGTMLSASYPFLLAGFMYQAATYTDRLMLGALASELSVGRYGAAAMIAQQVSAVSVAAVAFVVMPVLARLAVDSDRRDELRSLYRRSTKWMITIGIMIAMVAFVLREPLLKLYGMEFTVASGTLAVLLVGHLAFVAVGPSGEMLQMGGWERLDLKNTMGMVAINVILNAALIPPLGAMGAAVATAMSILVINAAQLLELRRIYGIKPWAELALQAKVGFLLIMSIGVGTGIGENEIGLSWKLGCSIVIASVLIYALIMTESERRVARNVVESVGSTFHIGR